MVRRVSPFRSIPGPYGIYPRPRERLRQRPQKFVRIWGIRRLRCTVLLSRSMTPQPATTPAEPGRTCTPDLRPSRRCTSWSICPQQNAAVAEDDEALQRRAERKRTATPISAPDAKPVDPTVLVFRDGHHQEVTNYAIMGQTVYVFDTHTQKIALTDLDVAATVKLNDDRGVDFHVPAAYEKLSFCRRTKRLSQIQFQRYPRKPSSEPPS